MRADDNLKVNGPGWAGRAVVIKGLAPKTDGKVQVLCSAWLDESGTVLSDSEQAMRSWQSTGIVGRAGNGRLFPKDGQRFLDELPYSYKNAHMQAQPISLADLEMLVKTKKQK
jgi:hypothetical protein